MDKIASKNMTKKTPEQTEYEELTKRMRIVTAKMRAAQEGVDVSTISQQKLDMVLRAFDDMDKIQRENQQKTSTIQQSANAEIQKINQETGKKFSDVQKKYQDLIKSLKEIHPQIQIDEQLQTGEQIQIEEQTIKEEVREKTHEEKVVEITDIVLKSMRDSVSSRIDEILKIVDSKTEIAIEQDKKI